MFAREGRIHDGVLNLSVRGGVAHIDFVERLALCADEVEACGMLRLLEDSLDVPNRFLRLCARQSGMAACMADNARSTGEIEPAFFLRPSERGSGERRAARSIVPGIFVGVQLAWIAEMCGRLRAGEKHDL